MDLGAIRTDVADRLIAVGIKAIDYTSEVITPPSAAVVPGQPYLTWGDDGSTFSEPVLVHIDVLLIVSREVNKKAAKDVDELVTKALGALLAEPSYDVTEVSQPGVVNLSGSKFMGSVITIQQSTEEPENP